MSLSREEQNKVREKAKELEQNRHIIFDVNGKADPELDWILIKFFWRARVLLPMEDKRSYGDEFSENMPNMSSIFPGRGRGDYCFRTMPADISFIGLGNVVINNYNDPSVHEIEGVGHNFISAFYAMSDNLLKKIELKRLQEEAAIKFHLLCVSTVIHDMPDLQNFITTRLQGELKQMGDMTQSLSVVARSTGAGTSPEEVLKDAKGAISRNEAKGFSDDDVAKIKNFFNLAKEKEPKLKAWEAFDGMYNEIQRAKLTDKQRGDIANISSEIAKNRRSPIEAKDFSLDRLEKNLKSTVKKIETKMKEGKISWKKFCDHVVKHCSIMYRDWCYSGRLLCT